MSDISKLTVNNVTYNIKDADARTSVSTLTNSLGLLAYKNNASGSASTFTFAVDNEILTITASTETVTVS